MFIPINTDAPVYHFPVVTIGLIVVNTLCFFVTGAGSRPELVDPWILWFGELRPLQWLTAVFMHADFGHLIGNMIFLWVFGMVVEGKLGWFRFLALYLACGVTQCAIEQVCMLGADREGARLERIQKIEDLLGVDVDENAEKADGPPIDPAELNFEDPDQIKRFADQLAAQPMMFGALGASGAIYSLLAISLVWAPKNEITVVGLILYRPVIFSVSILLFAGFYIALDFIFAGIGSFNMSTAVLHTVGAMVGFPVGVWLLKKGIVDCEDWDLFAVMSGRYGPYARDIYGYKTSKDGQSKYDAAPEEDVAKKPKKLRGADAKLKEIAGFVESGEYLVAAEELAMVRIRHPKAQLDEPQLKELANGLLADKEYSEVETVLEEYIDTYPDDANWACIRLAAIQLQVNGQPRAAVRTLKQVSREGLTSRQKELGRKLMSAARQQIADGVEDRAPEW